LFPGTFLAGDAAGRSSRHKTGPSAAASAIFAPMTCAVPSNGLATAAPGQIRLVDPSARAALEAAAVAEGLLLVPLPSPSPAQRGRLALQIESAIEDALERRGAAPPGVGASSDLDASLSDQLYRARQVGVAGIVISLYSLAGIANLASALDAEDSAVLRWWLATAGERPVRLLLDQDDRDLSIYGPPLALHRLIEPVADPEPATEDAPPAACPELVASSAAMELSAPPPPTEPAAPPPPAPAVRKVSEAEWRGFVRELESTRGPKPLSVVERTFVSAYVPLADALARGLADETAAAGALEAWGTAFDKSYSEAFDALRLRGKRPTMVLDVPEIALRIGRLHGARSVQLVLVDGMRFDLGVRIHERMRPLVGQRATLTERLLLWSALPTTTGIQLELIARGPAGLREPVEPPESELPVARGKNAAVLRRLRSGHKELLKLDLIESAFSVPGGPLAERLDCLADEAAEILAQHLCRQAPRTLVVLFGDHGFVVEPEGGGTGVALQGGASPEEVLVPAFAWLVGAVH
jgi:hypothetical protein